MRLELVSLVLVLAIAGGLALGGGMSGGFFSMFSGSGSPDGSQISAGESTQPDTSGFDVRMKTTGSGTSGSPEGPEEADEPETVTSPPITGFTGSGGGNKADEDSTPSEDKESITYISISPVRKEVSAGETFYVDVDIDTEEPVLVAGFGIEYDNDILDFTNEEGDVTNGGFMYPSGSGDDRFVFFGYENSVKIFITTGTKKGVSGSGRLVRIYFTALNETGESRLDFGFADFSNEEVGSLLVSTSGGLVDVQ